MKKKHILFFYGLILVAINLLAIFFTNSFVSYVSDTELFNLMKEYLSNNNILRIITMIIPFVVPCALCTVYAKNHNCNDVQQEKKLLVNTPLVFSLIGISGWTTGLAINIILIFYLKLKIGFSALSIIWDYTFSHIFLMIFTFMGTFFTLETINRKFVLPRFIPDGHISEIKGVINPSITLIYILLYKIGRAHV